MTGQFYGAYPPPQKYYQPSPYSGFITGRTPGRSLNPVSEKLEKLIQKKLGKKLAELETLASENTNVVTQVIANNPKMARVAKGYKPQPKTTKMIVSIVLCLVTVAVIVFILILPETGALTTFDLSNSALTPYSGTIEEPGKLRAKPKEKDAIAQWEKDKKTFEQDTKRWEKRGKKTAARWILNIPVVLLILSCIFLPGIELLKGKFSPIDLLFKAIPALVTWPFIAFGPGLCCCFCIWWGVISGAVYDCEVAEDPEKCNESKEPVWKGLLSSLLVSYGLVAGIGTIVVQFVYEFFIKKATPLGKAINSAQRVTSM